MEEEKWIKWSRELLSISKTGITYAKTYYDEERFKRIYEIAEEIVNTNFKTMPEMRIITQDIQKGYATPQVTTRGIIKRKNEILLVHEKGKQWNTPGLFYLIRFKLFLSISDLFINKSKDFIENRY